MNGQFPRNLDAKFVDKEQSPTDGWNLETLRGNRKYSSGSSHQALSARYFKEKNSEGRNWKYMPTL
jgi:hypothetical protein